MKSLGSGMLEELNLGNFSRISRLSSFKFSMGRGQAAFSLSSFSKR